jgi:hypothetical protein
MQFGACANELRLMGVVVRSIVAIWWAECRGDGGLGRMGVYERLW